jgi:predicted nucleotidyltransferase
MTIAGRTTKTINEFIDAAFSKSGLCLLRLFLYNSGLEVHQAEAINASGLSRMTATKLLKIFEKSGILKVSKKGDLKLYSIVTGHPIVRQLKIFLNVSDISLNLKNLSGKDVEIYLFGSAARGEDTVDSDIDLLIITSLNKDIIFKALGKLRYALNREINPIIYTPMEYSKLPVTDKAFFEGFEKDKIRLV